VFDECIYMLIRLRICVGGISVNAADGVAGMHGRCRAACWRWRSRL